MNQASSLENLTLLELLDRILGKGVVISGDIIISVAEVDLIYLGLRLVLGSIDTIRPAFREGEFS
ncbi:hypothetical membrane protein [Pelotomaculum thermopropionicum SI]|uniref:Hypothetical membrane protein n=1 Tax=Pelotomaculum thermopropionicum (strain DSM 13744 / JCM 10971 / SI) TaxID=370438 RepID=A5D581_PELTS|nr:hypothetical membrane protein [Pelotomaculum thermopropionicum SI]